MNKKGKSVTFRMSEMLYEKCVKRAIKKTNEEGKIIKVSEVIREILEGGV